MISSEEYFKRTPFNEETMRHLGKERVLIVGVGSVGAPMGLELAKAGVGSLIPVDKDYLEPHNCMRHVLGISDVGKPKAIAYGHHLKEQVPTCECHPIHEDLFVGDRSRLREVIEQHRPTRILAVTDSLHVQYLCQQAALYFNLPLMAVWCDNNAVEGEIFFWEPGQARKWKRGLPERGCYGCMRDPNVPTITRSTTFDYSNDDPGSFGGELALGAFINHISNKASIYMTSWMLSDCPVRTQLGEMMEEHYEGFGLQYIRLGGPYRFDAEGQVTASAPWAVDWCRVQKRPDCPFCSNYAKSSESLFPTEKDDTGSRSDNWGEFESPEQGARS